MQSEISPAKGLNMKLVPSLLVFAIAAGVVPDAAAGQKARPDPVASILSQAGSAAGSTPQPDYILNECKETESTGDPKSAMHAVDPAYMLKNYIQSRDRRLVELADINNVVLLQGATVGKITSVVDNTGRSWYRYDAPENYEGDDKAVFMAEYQGARYKIVVNFMVMPVVDVTATQCDAPKLIKVNKPSSGASGFGAGYDLSSVSVNFADLQGAAVGRDPKGDRFIYPSDSGTAKINIGYVR